MFTWIFVTILKPLTPPCFLINHMFRCRYSVIYVHVWVTPGNTFVYWIQSLHSLWNFNWQSNNPVNNICACGKLQYKLSHFYNTRILSYGYVSIQTYLVYIALTFPTQPWVITNHDDVIKWKHFPRYWPFVRGIHWSPVNFPHKGQWRGVLMFSLICTWINGCVNNDDAGDLRRHYADYDVIAMFQNMKAYLIWMDNEWLWIFLNVTSQSSLRNLVALRDFNY